MSVDPDHDVERPGSDPVPDPDAFAVLVCDWSLEVQPGQQVLVQTTTLAQDAAAALSRAIIERDAWPLLRLSPPSADHDFYRHAHDRHLDGFAPVELVEARAVDSLVKIAAPADTRPLAAVDPALPARLARGRMPLAQARSELRWCGTIWPTAALAAEAGLPEPEYRSFVTRALFLDRPNPLAAWQQLSARQSALVERLERAREVRIESERTDLRLDVAGRRWVNSDGRRNMPSGEVFTGPHERSANGTIRFDVPSVARGADVSGVELRFVDGEVVAAHADEGAAHLRAALALDQGARYLGELGIGTNTGIERATGSTLLDEKIAGTVHLALGRSYPETGGVNESALHWDLICDLRGGGRVSIDGETLIQDGVLVG